MGLQVGPTTDTRLTNLRFADDVLLFARSSQHIAQMLRDLRTAALEFDLEIHPEKTKVLTNATMVYQLRFYL